MASPDDGSESKTHSGPQMTTNGMGCVNGSCHAEVPLGPPPLQCANGGPAISFGDGGTADCAGNLAQRTFRWALCSCDSMTLSATFVTDGFDSTQGPFAD